jgi:hypothetical protein
VNHSGAAGVYDDGYVHPDPYTASDNPLHGTTYFGYDNNNGQYAGNTLAMHNTTSFTANGGTKANGDPLPGLDLAYGGNLWYWKRLRIGWDLGFGFMPVTISGHESMRGTVSQTAYAFDTTGVVLPPGAYYGPADGSGTVSIPVSPYATNSSSGVSGSIAGKQTLDVMLYTLRLGPSLYWDFNRYLGMSVSAGGAMGIVSGSLKHDETITTSSTVPNTGTDARGTKFVYGGYVNATLMYHVMQNGDLYVGAQYMPLGNATLSGHGRQGTLELGGALFISAGVNWPF